MKYILATELDIEEFSERLVCDFSEPPKPKEAEQLFSFVIHGLLNGNGKIKSIQRDFKAAFSAIEE